MNDDEHLEKFQKRVRKLAKTRRLTNSEVAYCLAKLLHTFCGYDDLEITINYNPAKEYRSKL